MTTLTAESVSKILQNIFPPQNNFMESSYQDELEELKLFGITTEEQLTAILEKHKQAVLEIDAEELDQEHIQWYSAEFGEAAVKMKVENKFWFALAGLLRITMELEFGDKYLRFSEQRDQLN